MTKIVPNDLLKPTEKSIKNWNCSFIAVEGPNVLDKLSLEDLEIPYESQYRARVVLGAGEVDQPLIYGFVGKSVTFLMIKVTYDSVNDPYYRYEQENYNITYYFENDPTLRPLGRLMIMTGSATDKIPQIYLNNPLDYDVVLDILHATVDSEYSGITSSYEGITLSSDISGDVTNSGISFNGTKTTFTYGEAISFGDILFVSGDTLAYKANALTGDTLPVMFMALEYGVSGDTKQVLLNGFVNYNNWDFTVNEVLYCSLTGGTMTQNYDDLSVGNMVQVVANPIKNTTIYFDPKSFSQK